MKREMRGKRKVVIYFVRVLGTQARKKSDIFPKLCVSSRISQMVVMIQFNLGKDIIYRRAKELYITVVKLVQKAIIPSNPELRQGR